MNGPGGYYISSNSTPSVASAQVSGSGILLSAISAGSTNVSVCESGGGCSTLSVSVGGTTTVSPVGCTSTVGFSTVTGQSCASWTPTTTSGTVPVTPSAPAYTFSNHISYGDSDTDVLQLQQLLVTWGFLAATPNGHFGPATQAALESFQSAHGLSPTGEVGPATRNELNQLQVTSGGSTTRAQQIQAIQSQIQQLQTQLNTLEAGQ